MTPSAVVPPRGVRAGLAGFALFMWFWTQSLIGQRVPPAGTIGDLVLDVLTPLHQMFLENPSRANALLIVSSAVIDVLAGYLFLGGVLGRTIRPFLGLVILFTLRQLCQALCALPIPEEMIWRYPGFPSLLVTYGVSNDLFFSGHTAIAVYGGIELARRGTRPFVVLGVFIAVFEISTVLVLRAHYTMDVFTGIITALYIGTISPPLAARADALLHRLFGRARAP